jgi:SHS2 domain-containing protein
VAENVSYRYLPHTADIRVEIRAADLTGLFEDACRLLRELFVGPSHVGTEEGHALELETDDSADLLISFLREGLYLFATEAFVPTDLSLRKLTPTSLSGSLKGEQFDPSRHQTQPEVKAVTRHGLVVQASDHGWRAEIVFDL